MEGNDKEEQRSWWRWSALSEFPKFWINYLNQTIKISQR